MKIKELSILCLLSLLPVFAAAQLQPSWLFDDNAVLQREAPIPVWGEARPRAEVTVTLGGVSLSTLADDRGQWRLSLPAMEADGRSHTLVIESEGQRKECLNVKIGEVWVASGQSNMEYLVRDGLLDFDREVAAAEYPDIRYFPVGLSPAGEPRMNGPERKWRPVTHESVLEMSAVAYYFARNLHLERHVPVGVIVAARGATEIGTWISGEMLATHPLYRERVVNFEPEAWRQRERDAENHQAIRDSIQNHSFEGLKQGVVRCGYKDGNWRKVTFPFGMWQLTGRDFWGVIWFRKHFTLTAAQSGKAWTLKLPVNDVGDIQYVNGKEVGRKNSIMPEILEIPVASGLRKGDNVFALRMTTTWGLCNIGNEIDREAYLESADGERIDLTGEWLYNYELEPPMPLLSNYYNEPTVNFNGMIAPIAGYGIRGFIWYQGEGNTGYHPEEYANLKRMLIEDWRIRWKMGYLPFLYVQLANMNRHSDEPRDYDGWAVLRDSQTALLETVPAVGMASAIDIGEWNNAHPLNKREVGRRLYQAARAVAYGENALAGGPILREVKRDGNSLRLSYDCAPTGLMTPGNVPVNSFAVSDASGHWQWVKARIGDGGIVVDLTGIDRPVRLQYAWQANPEANLYNREGLPAIPFNVQIPE